MWYGPLESVIKTNLFLNSFKSIFKKWFILFLHRLQLYDQLSFMQSRVLKNCQKDIVGFPAVPHLWGCGQKSTLFKMPDITRMKANKINAKKQTQELFKTKKQTQELKNESVFRGRQAGSLRERAQGPYKILRR